MVALDTSSVVAALNPLTCGDPSTSYAAVVLVADTARRRAGSPPTVAVALKLLSEHGVGAALETLEQKHLVRIADGVVHLEGIAAAVVHAARSGRRAPKSGSPKVAAVDAVETDRGHQRLVDQWTTGYRLATGARLQEDGTVVGGAMPTNFGRLAAALRRLRAEQPDNEIEKRMARFFRSRVPAFIWRDGSVPDFSAFVQHFDKIPAAAGSAPTDTGSVGAALRYLAQVQAEEAQR